MMNKEKEKASKELRRQARRGAKTTRLEANCWESPLSKTLRLGAIWMSSRISRESVKLQVRAQSEGSVGRGRTISVASPRLFVMSTLHATALLPASLNRRHMLRADRKSVV